METDEAINKQIKFPLNVSNVLEKELSKNTEISRMRMNVHTCTYTH